MTLNPGDEETVDPGLTIANDGQVPLTYEIVLVNQGSVETATAYSKVLAAVDSFASRSGLIEGPVELERTEEPIVGTAGAAVLTSAEDVVRVVAAEEAGVVTSTGLNVAVLGADGGISDVQAKLLGTGQFNSVTTFDVNVMTPTLAEVEVFDAVMVYSNMVYADATALGNIMADYADGGGGVVCAMFELAGFWAGASLEGRWLTDDYQMMAWAADVRGTQQYLGTVHEPGHPIMAGVSSFAGGTDSFRPGATTVRTGADVIAEWTDGRFLVVADEVGGTFRRVDLGFFPVSIGFLRRPMLEPGDRRALLMANALTWAGSPIDSWDEGPWLSVESPASGEVPGETSLDKWVAFDTALLEPGRTYHADIEILSDDPDEPTVVVPCSLTVPPDPLAVSPEDGFAFGGLEGGPFTPSYATYTLTNEGTEALDWTAAWPRAGSMSCPRAVTLDAGASVDVEVAPSAVAETLWAGTYQDTVEFTNATYGATQMRDVAMTVASVASLPFVEDFESGQFLSYWEVSGTGTYQSTVTRRLHPPRRGLPRGLGRFRVRPRGSRNELTLTLDLRPYENVVLSFWALDLGDEPHGPPPAPFTGGADFDGVAVSADGVDWYEVEGTARGVRRGLRRVCRGS